MMILGMFEVIVRGCLWFREVGGEALNVIREHPQ